MTANIALGALVDPTCGRNSADYVCFSVGCEHWEVQWGRFDAFGTAAYWVNQTLRGGYADRVAESAQETDLFSETVFCLLGGFGITAELAQAAHRVVVDLLETDPLPRPDRVEQALRRRLPDGLGHYRFPRQRALRIADAVRRLRADSPPEEPLLLRDYLLSLNGVGPKTAAWIVRNVTGSAEVAIVDIWLIRALTQTGVFRPDWRIDRHYGRFEAAFLQYATHGGVSPGALDLCIWEQARRVGRFLATSS